MDDRIKRVLFHIEQNITEPVDLAKLADVACLSPHHFHRLFKAEQGETPKAYVDRVRLEHVAHMMVIRKDLGLTELAFEYGFSSPAAFTRAFKANFKVAPRAFRDTQREAHRERLEKHWASLEDGESFAPRKIVLNHMALKRLKAVRLLMQEEALNDAYKTLITENAGRISHGLTIYTEGPFQADRDSLRLHIALDENMAAGSRGDILELRSGYYHQQLVTGDFDAMTDTMFKTFQRDIEPSRYKVASTTFYERVKLPAVADGFDYFSSERTVFGCLTRK
ncbi:MAG: helix-turn-helix transcriptional regulator [Kordiimonadaceae bacterium]|nr:helix-turn-helix transcriptional regulator [Kordiimonadaceae bacterium]